MGDCNCDLLLWKRPVETGKVFGGLLVMLLVLKKVNLITFFLKVMYTVLLLSSGVEFVSKLVLGQGLVTKYGMHECPNVVGMLRPKIDKFLKNFPRYQAGVRELVFASSPQRTFKAASVLFVAHSLVSAFSLWTLMFFGVIAAFTLPVVYNANRKEIDAAIHKGVDVAKAKSDEYKKVLCEKTQPMVKQLEDKLGPLSQYLLPKNGSSCAPASAGSSKNATEEPAVGHSSSASFSQSAKLSSVPVETADVVEEDVDMEQLKQELKDNKEALGI